MQTRKVDSTLYKYLEYSTGEHEVSADIMFTELFTGIQAERTVLVVDLFLRRITQNAVSMVYFLELNKNNTTVSQTTEQHLVPNHKRDTLQQYMKSVACCHLWEVSMATS